MIRPQVGNSWWRATPWWPVTRPDSGTRGRAQRANPHVIEPAVQLNPIERPSVKFDQGAPPGPMSRYHAWKCQVSPA